MINNNDVSQQVENAYFIMLSLCRELYLCVGRNPEKSEEYLAKTAALKKDMRYKDKPQLIAKAQQVYAPQLKKLLGKKI